MPRDALIQQTFEKGIFPAMDQADIPDGGAAWSTDEHVEAAPGVVESRYTESTAFDTNDYYGIEKHCWITRANGKRDLIFSSKQSPNTKIDSISDFFSAKTYATQLTLSGNPTIAMDVINRMVRIGQGDADTQYVGYIDHGQWGASAPTSLESGNSELAPPSEFPILYNAFHDGTNIYGIEWEGKRIYKIVPATGAITMSDTFNSLQGLCIYPGDTDYFFVYDRVGDFGNILKIKKSDLSISVTAPIDGWGGSGTTTASYQAGTTISDIVVPYDNNKMFFAMYHPSTPLSSGGIPALFATTLSDVTAGNHITPSIYWDTDVKESTTTDGEVWTGLNSGLWTSRKALFLPPATGDTTQFGFYTYINMEVIFTDTGTPTVDEAPKTSIIWFSSSASDLLNYSGSGKSYPFETASTGLVELSDLGDSTDFSYISSPCMVYQTGTSKYWLIVHNSGNSLIAYDITSRGRNIATSVWYDHDSVHMWVQASSSRGTWTRITATTPGYNTTLVCIPYNDGVTYAYAYLVGKSSAEIGCLFYGRITGSSLWDSLTYVKRSSFGLYLQDYASPPGVFSTQKRYFYRFSYVYDYYQESPLSSHIYSDTVGSATNSFHLILQFYDVSNLEPRITAIKVYRAEALATDAEEPVSQYRLVGSVSLEENAAYSTLTGWGSYKILELNDLGNYGTTYEAETGVPETLPNNTLNYSVSATGGGYLFAAKAYNDELESIENFIFRSKKNCPDTFDWSNDFLVLPEMVIALHYFRGSLFAFSETTLYMIEPETLSLIGSYPGYGVQTAKAVTSNEGAMFFANNENVYIWDGKNVEILSEPINRIGTIVSTATSHRTLASTMEIELAIAPKQNALIVAYHPLTGTGGLAICTIDTPGSGYSPYDICTVTGGGGTGGKVTIVTAPAGIPGSITVSTQGSGYTFTDGAATTGGGGSGLKVDITGITNSETKMFVFHLPKKAWYYWIANQNTGTYINCFTFDKRSLIQDYLGDIYLSVYKGILKLCGSTNKKAATWFSREFSFGDNTVLKKIYKIFLHGENIASPTVYYNGAASGTSMTSGAYLSAASTKVRSVQIGVTLQTSAFLRGITIVFRRMIGLR